jgi:hypothetical protein
MIVAAREFTSAAEMRAAAAAVHNRLLNTKGPAIVKAEPVEKVATPVIQFLAPVVRAQRARNLKQTPKVGRGYSTIWEIHPTQFNHHVIIWRRHMLALDMLESPGEVVVNFDERLPILEIAIEVLTAFPGVTIEEIRGSRRTRRIVLPRQLAMYQAYRQRSDLSLPLIGRWFGGRDHTTVLHAIRKIEALRGEA